MIGSKQLSRLGLFDARVPRYTSYPTAPQFSDAVGPEDTLGWISEITPDQTVSLYLHIPFCRRLCWFCACRTQGTKTNAPVAAYLETLKKEIALVADRIPAGVELSRIHWGGGTPTLLSAEMITDLAAAIEKAFRRSPQTEFSVEIDPNEIDSTRIEALAKAGMNRASIGIQDFDPEIQSVIGRIQTYEQTREAVEGLRAVGIPSLNADILYGLPHQSRARITESVQKLLSLNPDRVALYGYAHVPWMARRQQMIPSEALPPPEERLELFETARRLMVWDGYKEIGIDHFARPEDSMAIAAATGRLRRNFQGYTDDTCDVLIGLGASAISRYPQGYAQNSSATSEYATAIQNGAIATTRGHVFQGEDTLRARLIEALMCDFQISTDEICEGFGVDRGWLDDLFAKVAEQFPDMVTVSDWGLRVKNEVLPLARLIARSFDAYQVSEAGHSHAI